MRPELEIIQRWIEPGSRVLDLGCGDGSLLTYLNAAKKVSSIGLEIDAGNIEMCIASGVNVIEQNMDEGLSNFQSNSFDTVLLTQTLQALSKPHDLLDEMLRVGRMPVSKFMPHQWYETPNIHFCTVKDFDALCHESQIKILTRTVVDSRHQGSWAMKAWPNFLGEIAIYHITRK